jgi:hypothetical protein
VTSSQNNTSTIDTLIEKERDNLFLDRMDKENKQKLKIDSYYKRSNSTYGSEVPQVKSALNFYNNNRVNESRGGQQ